MIKRIIAAITAAALCFVLISCAEKTDLPLAYESFTTVVDVSSDYTNVEAHYTDEYVYLPPTQYNYDTALFCATMAMATYTSETEVAESLKELGFSGETVYNYQSDEADKVAYILAAREFDGVNTVIAVIRGSDGKEWISDFNIAEKAFLEGDTSIYDKGYHEGFYLANEEFMAAFEQYCSKLGNVGNVIITGHSRGGAVANLAAAELCEAGKYNVFCYTFASPNVKIMTDVEKGLNIYDCIFNIANPEDIFTHMPSEEWGFELYGKKLMFDKADAATYDAFLLKYSELVNAEYSGGYENGVNEIETQFSKLMDAVPDIQTYYKTSGASAYKTLNILAEFLAGGELDIASLFLSSAMSGTSDFVTFFAGNTDTIFLEHSSLTYLSWMQVEGIFEAAEA